MFVIRLIACALILFAMPTFAAETVKEPVAKESPAAEQPVADLVEKAECAQRSTAEQSETDATLSVLDPTIELLKGVGEPAAAAPESNLSCGGPFPVHSPGACNQTCAPCLRNSDCPPMWGRPQKCCSYCP